MHRSTAPVLLTAAGVVDARGLARGRFADSSGRYSVEGAIQVALVRRGGTVREHALTYSEAVLAAETVVAAEGFEAPAGRQLLSAWSDQATVEAAVALLEDAADLAEAMAGGDASPARLASTT